MNNRNIGAMSLALLLLCMSVSAAFPAVRAWELDKNHSNIYFTADHVFSKVRGRFDDFSTQVLFDPNNLDESRFTCTIKVKSIDTANGKRDKHLLSADFFDASNYPTITFVSRRITAAGKDVYDVAGRLNVKGRESDLTLPLHLAGIKEHPAEKEQLVAGFNGTIILNLRSLQVGEDKFFALGLIGPEVEVLVTLELLSPK